MKRLSGVAAGVLCLVGTVLAAEPPKGDAVKPPWQRLLQGEDARKAAGLEAKLAQLQEAGRLTEALQAAQALVELRSKVQGADHWQAVNAHWDAAALQSVCKQGDEAGRKFSRSRVLQRQADTLVEQERSREAQPLLEEVLSVRRTLLGEEHPHTATGFNNAAFNLHSQGRYREAEEGFRKALAIRRKVLGEEHADTARSYNNMAYNLDAQGRYPEAEEGYRKALVLYRRLLGEEHPHTALGYNNLAASLQGQGRYREAEEGLRKARVLQRKLLGEEHPQTGLSYNNAAANLEAQGRHPEAEESYHKALTIWRKVLGERHPLTATCYNNLAGSLDEQGRYREAEEGYQKALAIRREVLGEEHPDTVQSYNNVAGILHAQGKYAQAEEGYRKALTLHRKLLGEEHPHVALGYHNLAGCQYDQGKYEQAEDGFRKALDLRRKLLGEEHPSTALSYRSLARSLHAQGRYKEAEQVGAQAAQSFEAARLRIAASGLGRAARAGELSPLPALAAVLARKGKPEAAWQRYEQSLSRGTWDDLSARLRRPPAEQARQGEMVRRLERLDQLIAQTFRAQQDSSPLRQRRQELLSQRRQLQEKLDTFAQQLEKRFGPAAGQVFSQQQIQAALPADTALVGWLDRPGDARAADPNGEHWAVLLRSKGPPRWVRLRGSGAGGAWSIEDTLLPARLRQALLSRTGSWQDLRLRLRQQRLAPLLAHLAGGEGLPAVRHLVVLPSPALAGVPVEVLAEGSTVSYALSGTLHAHLRRQPRPAGRELLALADPAFAAPPGKDKAQPLPVGGVLLTMVAPGSNAARAGLRPNDVLLRHGETDLNGPADLARALRASGAPERRIPIIVWRDGQKAPQPLFVSAGQLGVVVADGPAPQAIAEQRRWDRRLASRGGDVSWPDLPGTRFEVEALLRLFAGSKPAPTVLVDSQASEQQLHLLAGREALRRFGYLHLATHGAVDNRLPLRSAVILARDQLPDAGQQLEAGLPVFDGRLSAAEVLQQWHLDSDLVTLSACETALGKYEQGEGFVGFAQALILAGSRSVCLSLWKVDDAATALLMERFYQNLLGKRPGLQQPMAKAQALAEAKSWLRGLTQEEALARVAQLSLGVTRGKGRKLQPLAMEMDSKDRPYAHPYYWAAFVLIGLAD